MTTHPTMNKTSPKDGQARKNPRSIHGGRETEPSRVNYEKYTPYFPGSTKEVIKKTFAATTQYGKREAVEGINLRRQIKSPNPALNVPRRNEPVATETVEGTEKEGGEGEGESEGEEREREGTN